MFQGLYDKNIILNKEVKLHIAVLIDPFLSFLVNVK